MSDAATLLPSTLQEAIKVAQPLLLWKIIQYFESYKPSDQRSLAAVYCYAAALSLSAFAQTALQHVYYYLVLRLGMKMRVAVCHLVYGKVSARADQLVGEILSKCHSKINVCPQGAESE